MIVYEINEDWYVAPTPREAFDAMLSDCELSEDESCIGLGEVKPLDAAAMERLVFHTDAAKDAPRCSFAARYYELVSRGELDTGLFATQNY